MENPVVMEEKQPAAKPKVLILNEVKDWGGGEEVTLNLSSALLKTGVSLIFGGNPGSTLLNKAREAGIPSRAIPMRNELDLPAVLTLRKIITAEKISVLHCQSMRDHVLACLAARFNPGVRVFRTQHIHHPEGFSLTSWAAYRHFTHRILCVSDFIRRDLLSAGLRDKLLKVVYAGIDTRRFEPFLGDRSFRAERNLNEKTTAVGCFGNLFKSKGQQDLISVVKKLLDKKLNLHLFLAGRGPDQDRLQTISAELGITEHVTFLGFRDDVPRLIGSMDVMVTPSVWDEPAGLINLEALFMEKPLVATRVGGIPELVEDEVTGFLVPPGDREALAQKIEFCIMNREKTIEMARNGARRVRERHTLEAMAGQVLLAYGE
ncbi:MAG: glycosyltransferase family 4 protein [bacterium]